MRVKIHSSEINRMMKPIVQCVDEKFERFSNIEIKHEDNLLTIRATDGTFYARASAPVMGGDGEKICVDGTMFARVCGMCSGEIEISADEKTCTIKGAGRTRIPVVKADFPDFESTEAQSTITIKAEDYIRCYNSVAYAVSNDQSRIVLTGILFETDINGLKMVAIDGFQLAIEQAECDWEDGTKSIVPGSFAKLVASSITAGETLKLTFGKNRIQAETDSVTVYCGLLAGTYVDYAKIVPQNFKTECAVRIAAVKDALKSGSVVNSKNSLVKMVIGDNLRIMSNSEQADYEAEIECERIGDGLSIAFNPKYIMNAVNAINADDAVMKFNSPMTPCVIQAKGETGVHLVLPVRVAG